MMFQQHPSIGEVVQLMSSSLLQVASFERSKLLSEMFYDNDDVPSLTSILKWLDVKQRIKLEDEERMAYEVIFSSFFLKLLDDGKNNYDNELNNVTFSHVTETLNKELKCLARNSVSRLKAH